MGTEKLAHDSTVTPTKLKSFKWSKELLLRNNVTNPLEA